jgi:DNA-binding LytR/AlgR family response regulator
MEISCIAIDDEPLALSKIEGFICKIQGLKLLRTFDNAIEVIGWLKENSTDLIFLDIQMEELNGIQFLEVAGVDTRVIITSAHEHYAIKGFELNVCDYLLKPYSFQRFLGAVARVQEFYSIRNGNRKDDQQDKNYIFVKTEYRLEKIDLDSILYIEGMKDYLRIVCTDKKIMTLQSFSRFEANLPANRFCRVHKSYIVSFDKIRSIERGVILIADKRIPVTNKYGENLYSKIRLK